MIENIEEVDRFIRLSQRKLIIDKIADKNLRNAVLSRNALVETARIKKVWVLNQWKEQDLKKILLARKEQEQEEEEEELDRGAVTAPTAAATTTTTTAGAPASDSKRVLVVSLKRTFSSWSNDANNTNENTNHEHANRKRPHVTSPAHAITPTLEPQTLACFC